MVRFECRLNRDRLKFHVLNPVWDNGQVDALNIFEIVDLLNKQSNQIAEQGIKLDFLLAENEDFQHKYLCLRDRLDDALAENEELREALKKELDL